MDQAQLTPFTIAVPDRDLRDLAGRLARTRFPPPLPDDDWDTGVPVAYLRELVEYWRTGYDWRAAEQGINAWPQFTTQIDGTRIHFLHVRSPHPARCRCCSPTAGRARWPSSSTSSGR